ncbi:MAG: hypothetical protein RID09_18170 [Coleofasciculus sp. G1-WW12-02]|uniref:hypothetical protein n=2 Tax=unclassified Coleofasciculus TaxID=2692782 RepID=UPI0032FFCA68
MRQFTAQSLNMLIVVIIFNLLISLFGFYLAWRIWKLRRVLAAAADIVALAERSTYRVLHGAPQAISRGQIGVHGLKKRYQHLEFQLQRVQRVLMVLGLIQKTYRSRRRRHGKRSPAKS